MNSIKSLLTLGILVSVLAAAFIRSGVYDVSASLPHYTLSKWLIDALKEHSIVYHAEGILKPDRDDAPQPCPSGFALFDASCRQCHGAPGEPRQDFASGLYPNPPVFVTGRVQQHWTEAQQFLIIRNGLRFTGMPAFAAVLSESEIWEIISVLKRLPEMKPSEYRALAADEEEPPPEPESGVFPEGSDPKMNPNTI